VWFAEKRPCDWQHFRRPANADVALKSECVQKPLDYAIGVIVPAGAVAYVRPWAKYLDYLKIAFVESQDDVVPIVVPDHLCVGVDHANRLHQNYKKWLQPTDAESSFPLSAR
jgi:hypothetical protein